MQRSISPHAARLGASLLCAATLASCRIGDPVSMFAPEAMKGAVAALSAKVGHPMRALRVDMDDDTFAIQAQDPATPSHVDEWTYHHGHVLGGLVHFEYSSGPTPVELSLINPNLEENLFNYSDVDFAAWPKLAQAAIERASLEDPGRVARVRIERQLFLIPTASSGDVRWTIEVGSGRETADVFATAHGAIVGGSFGNTLRAQRLDLRAGGAPLAEALRDLRAAFAAAPAIRRLLLTNNTISMTARSPDNPRRVGGYLWNLNGLQYQGEDTIQTPNPGLPTELFAVDDVDWSLLERAQATAKQRLEMPQGAVERIEITRPGSPGHADVQWEVHVTQRNDKGWVDMTTTGDVTRVHAPDNR
jgi:hypothetical protein